jgi:hypothetical protein
MSNVCIVELDKYRIERLQNRGVYWIDDGVALIDVLHLAFDRSAATGNDVCGDCGSRCAGRNLP